MNINTPEYVPEPVSEWGFMQTATSITRLIISLFFVFLYGCGAENNSRGNSSFESKASTEIPASVQKLALAPGSTLKAYITIDNNNKIEMNLDTAAAGSASVSIAGLSLASHRIVITYEYTLNGVIYTLATASKTIDLSSGSASLSFVSADYKTDTYDRDNDGISNVDELKNGTDPGVIDVVAPGPCVLDQTVIGGCVLG